MSNIVSKQVLEQAGIKLPMNVEHMLLCGGLEIRKLLTMIADTINRVVCTSDENAKRLQEWTGSVAGWAEEFEKQIRNAVQNGVMNNLTIADGAVTISKLSQDVKDKIQQAAESIPFLDVEATADSVTIVYDDTKEDVLHLVMATATMAGMMSAADKVKLDGLKNYVLPIAGNNLLGGVKAGARVQVKNGEMYTSLPLLGLTFEPEENRMKYVDEKGVTRYFALTPVEVQPDDGGDESNTIVVYVSSGSSIDALLSAKSKVDAASGEETPYQSLNKYFALYVPVNATLTSLTHISGGFASDLLADDDFESSPNVMIDGVVYVPYIYNSPRTSTINPTTYLFTVTKPSK